MRIGLIVCCFLWWSLAFSQDSSAVIQDTTPVILQFDTIPSFTFFDPLTVENHTSRIASLRILPKGEAPYFYAVLLFSVFIALIYINSKDLVSASLKSITSFQNTIHFSRTDKKTNIFYFVLYGVLFIVGCSMLFYYGASEVLQKDFSWVQVLLGVTAIFLLDYSYSYVLLLFTNNAKSVELIQAVVLNYAIILCLLVWPAMFFILLTGASIASIFMVLFLVCLGGVFLLKEIRVIQVLWFEKINIVSFHFFAYLCTFKFLPILLLLKIAFY